MYDFKSIYLRYIGKYMYALKAKEVCSRGIRYSEENKKLKPTLIDEDYYTFDVYLSKMDAVAHRLIITREFHNDTIKTFSLDEVVQNIPVPLWVEKLLAAAESGSFSYSEPRTFELHSEKGLSWYQPSLESTRPDGYIIEDDRRCQVFSVYKSPRTTFSLPDEEPSIPEMTKEPIVLPETLANHKKPQETEEHNLIQEKQNEIQETKKQLEEVPQGKNHSSKRNLTQVKPPNLEITKEPIVLPETLANHKKPQEAEEQNLTQEKPIEIQGTKKQLEEVPQEKNYSPKKSLEQAKDTTRKCALYIEKLLKATQKYKENLPKDYASIHVILDELIQGLQGEKNNHTIEEYYKVLGRTEPSNKENNLKVIEKNPHRSTAHFIMGIAAITLTIVTGVLPGLIAIAIVYALTRKTPLSLFKTQSEGFIDNLKQIEREEKAFNSHLSPQL